MKLRNAAVAAWKDYNNNGFLDLFVTNSDGAKEQIMKNRNYTLLALMLLAGPLNFSGRQSGVFSKRFYSTHTPVVGG